MRIDWEAIRTLIVVLTAIVSMGLVFRSVYMKVMTENCVKSGQTYTECYTLVFGEKK